MGDGSDPALLETDTPEPLEGLLEPDPTFDEKTAKEVIEITVGLLNDGASAVISAITKHETGDAALAKEAGESVRMSPKTESAIRTGGLACARKYGASMAYAPEILLGGGLVIWLGQCFTVAKAQRAKGAELRQRAQEQRQAA